MQTGIHYTKENKKVRVLNVDEDNKIAYVDYLDGQKGWVNEKEYNSFATENIETTVLPKEETFEVVLAEIIEPGKKAKKKKDDTANKK